MLSLVQEVQISSGDKGAIKSQLVSIMIALGNPATARLQAQIGEGLSTVAEKDFPEEWDGLVDVSTGHAGQEGSPGSAAGCGMNGLTAAIGACCESFTGQFRYE